MRKASTRLPEQGTQTPSPAPDLIPAETKKSTENSHSDWYSKRGHFTQAACRCNCWGVELHSFLAAIVWFGRVLQK